MVLDYPYEKLSSISIGKPMMILRKKIPAETENRNVKTDKQRNGKPKKKKKMYWGNQSWLCIIVQFSFLLTQNLKIYIEIFQNNVMLCLPFDLSFGKYGYTLFFFLCFWVRRYQKLNNKRNYKNQNNCSCIIAYWFKSLIFEIIASTYYTCVHPKQCKISF